MDIRIEKTPLLHALALARATADLRAPMMPILGHVRLATDGKEALACAATDLNVSVVAGVHAEATKAGAACVSAKAIHDIVKGLPDGEIRMRLVKTRVEITAGRARFELVTLPAADFPKVPDATDVAFATVEAAALTDLIAKTAYACSTDETRPHLCGAQLSTENGAARMVASNGHRLSKMERALNGASGFALPEAVLIPRKGLLAVQRVIDGAESCEVGVRDGTLFVRAARTLLAVRLSDAEFPPWEQVIPRDNDRLVTAPRRALLQAVERVSLMARGGNGRSGVKFDLRKGRLRLSSEDADLGEGHEEIEVAYDGQAVALGFNARYLTDLLAAIETDEVRMELAGELDAAVVRPVGVEGQIGVVMPMRW